MKQMTSERYVCQKAARDPEEDDEDEGEDAEGIG